MRIWVREFKDKLRSASSILLLQLEYDTRMCPQLKKGNKYKVEQVNKETDKKLC